MKIIPLSEISSKERGYLKDAGFRLNIV